MEMVGSFVIFVDRKLLLNKVLSIVQNVPTMTYVRNAYIIELLALVELAGEVLNY